MRVSIRSWTRFLCKRVELLLLLLFLHLREEKENISVTKPVIERTFDPRKYRFRFFVTFDSFFFFFGESTYIRLSILLNFIRLYFDVIIFLNFGFFFERRGGEEKKGNGIPLTAFVRCNSL